MKKLVKSLIVILIIGYIVNINIPSDPHQNLIDEKVEDFEKAIENGEPTSSANIEDEVLKVEPNVINLAAKTLESVVNTLVNYIIGFFSTIFSQLFK